KQLEKVQRRALRLTCAVFRTTPIQALEIEASVPPLRLSLDLERKRNAIRLNKLDIAHPIEIEKIRDDDTHLMVYSDGSLLQQGAKRSVGAGLVGYWLGEEVFTKKIGMGPKAEVYDAEMQGLAQAAQDASTFIVEKPCVTHLHFYADNT
ncbi:hypothetical protein C8R47DRAFT_920029, partial [Mycena vitilis]